MNKSQNMLVWLSKIVLASHFWFGSAKWFWLHIFGFGSAKWFWPRIFGLAQQNGFGLAFLVWISKMVLASHFFASFAESLCTYVPERHS
jgi:hypothetical protein